MTDAANDTCARIAAVLAAMCSDLMPADVETALCALNPAGIADDTPLPYDAEVAHDLSCRLLAHASGKSQLRDALTVSKWTHMCCTAKGVPADSATDMDKVEPMLDLMLSVTRWDIIPYTFIYTAYAKRAVDADGRVLGRNALLSCVRALMKAKPGWDAMSASDNVVYAPPRMSPDDPILDEFDMHGWYDTCTTKYHRGLLRQTQASPSNR